MSRSRLVVLLALVFATTIVLPAMSRPHPSTNPKGCARVECPNKPDFICCGTEAQQLDCANQNCPTTQTSTGRLISPRVVSKYPPSR